MTADGKPYPPGPAGPNVTYGAVVGRVGSGKPFLVGAHASAPGPGELYLVYNDCEPPSAEHPRGAYGDNDGAWTVSVTMRSA